MNSENPYSSPPALSVSPPDSVPSTFGGIARSTFLAWEKLRLVYVGLLAAVTLLLAALDPSRSFTSLRFWIPVVEGAVVANVCYFAGPIIETYVTWLGFRGRWLRYTLFVLGTLFSIMLAFGAIASLLLPTMD